MCASRGPLGDCGWVKIVGVRQSLGQSYANYFFALQPHPQPEAFSSFLIMQSLPPQSAHFLGLHLPSLVAPHFSHLNIAILPPRYLDEQLYFAKRDVRLAR